MTAIFLKDQDVLLPERFDKFLIGSYDPKGECQCSQFEYFLKIAPYNALISYQSLAMALEVTSCFRKLYGLIYFCYKTYKINLNDSKVQANININNIKVKKGSKKHAKISLQSVSIHDLETSAEECALCLVKFGKKRS